MSPQLDYKHAVRVLGAHAGARGFYAPIGEHLTVACPDCGQRADADFGDHGGDCLAHVQAAAPNTALGVIYRFARTHARFSANDCREAFDAANVKGTSRGPAFAAAERKEWIANDGYVRSTDGPTKGHPLAVYASRVYRGRAAS